MKVTLMILMAAMLGGCGNHNEGAASSTRGVDSAIKAAPDTIKAMPVDSARAEMPRR